MPKFGIGITSWNYPQYFRPCIETLAKNDLRDVDVHIFQEGRFCHIEHTDQRAHPDNIGYAKDAFDGADMPHKFWHQNVWCLGYYLNRVQMLDLLASNYDSFLTLEGDVISSSHMVRVVRQLIAQFGDNPRVGLISPSQKLLCKPEDREQYWDAVRLDEGRGPRLCVEAMTRETWQAIRPQYVEYGKVIASVPYHMICRQHIRDAVRVWAESRGSDITEVSGDTALYRTMFMAGKLRMMALVNRCTNVGDHGLNCNPEVLKEQGDGHQPLYEDEPPIGKFRIVEV